MDLKKIFILSAVFIAYFGNVELTANFYPFYEYQGSYPEVVSPYRYYGGSLSTLHPLTAVCQLKGSGESSVSGTAIFYQPMPPSGPVFVTGNVTGLTKGLHAMHIHENGDLRNGCESTGPHFNPYHTAHGSPQDPHRHVGDLGNVEAGDDGTVKLHLTDPVVSLAGPRSVVGRAVVIHANEDDFGRGATPESLTSGNAGARIACGIVGLVNVHAQHPTYANDVRRGENY